MIAQHNDKIVKVGGSLANFITGKGPVTTSSPVVDPLPVSKYLTYFDLSGFDAVGTCTDQPEINLSDPGYPIYSDKWYPRYYQGTRGTTVRTIEDGSVLDGCKEIYTINPNISGSGYKSTLLSCRKVSNGNTMVDSVIYRTGTINIRVKMGFGRDLGSQSSNSFITNGSVHLGGIYFDFKRYRASYQIDKDSSELWIHPWSSRIDKIDLFEGTTFEDYIIKYHNNMYESWITLGATVRDGWSKIYIDGTLIAKVKYEQNYASYACLTEEIELIAPESSSTSGPGAECTEFYLSDQDLSEGHEKSLNWPTEPLIQP